MRGCPSVGTALRCAHARPRRAGDLPIPKTATGKEWHAMTIQISAPSALTLKFRVLMAMGMALALVVALPGRSTAAQDPQAVVRYIGTQGMAAVGPDISPARRIAQLRELFQD